MPQESTIINGKTATSATTKTIQTVYRMVLLNTQTFEISYMHLLSFAILEAWVV